MAQKCAGAETVNQERKYKTIAWSFGLLMVLVTVFALVEQNAPPEDNYVTEASDAGPKPHDCDWLAAPLGSKSCHYEKTKYSSTAITGVDRSTGQTLLSEDYGRTWYTRSFVLVPSPSVGQRTIHLYVNYRWQKVTD
jgi:hypothetical protein